MASEVEIARGIWHPPGSSKALEATLFADGQRLAARLADRSLVGEESVGDMVISDRVGRIPRRISFADGGMFETGESESFVRTLAAIYGLKASSTPGGFALQPAQAAPAR